MRDYITREEAQDKYCETCNFVEICSSYCEGRIKFDEIPAADVKLVVRGEWKNGHCSVCGKDIASVLDTWTSVQKFDFCPNCGAEMGG